MGKPGVLFHCKLIYYIYPVPLWIYVGCAVQNKSHKMACSQDKEKEYDNTELIFVVFCLNVTVYFLHVFLQVPYF